MPGRPLRILVLSTFDGRNANVIADYLFAFNAYSRHEYAYVFDCRTLDGSTDFSRYDVITLFWSLYLLGPSLSESARDAIAASPALKVLFLQDEYREVRAMNAAMARLGVQVMCTCIAELDHHLFYPRTLIPTLEGVYTVLTGYVPAYLERVSPIPAEERELDIGYRSRAVPYWLGDLGREKTTIAERFARAAWEHGLRYDISVREEDRIYGRAWLRFLRSCRFTLGSGSGASVIDFTGEIRPSCEAFLAARPDAGYDEVRARFFADVDGTVVIDTISPRIFEAAAFGATLILHPGPYAGLLAPDVHYIPVRKDYANIPEVVEKMRDERFCRGLAERARADLIASGAHSYRAFAARFDAILARHRPEPAAIGLSRAVFYASAYLRHRQAIIPRGASFIVLPSPAGLKGALRRAAAALARAMPEWLRRLAHDPLQVLGKGWVAIAGALAEPAFTRLLVARLGDRAARRAAPLGTVLGELLRLEVVRRATVGRLVAGPSFTVTAAVDRKGRKLRITSRPAAAWAAADDGCGAGLAGLEELLAGGGLDAIVWDHSAVESFVPWPLTRTHWLVIRIGDAGAQPLTGLAALGAILPAATARALRAALTPPSPAARPAGEPRVVLTVTSAAATAPETGANAATPAMERAPEPASTTDPARPPRRGAARLLPLVRRAAANPRTLAEGATALARAIASPSLRPLLVGYMRSAGCRAELRPDELLEDLLRLDMLRLVRSGRVADGAAIVVHASLERSGKELIFRSTRREGSEPPAAPVPLPDTGVGALGRIVWDHSGVAPGVLCPIVGRHGITVALDESGVYDFKALPRLVAHLPAELRRALAAL